MKTINGFIKQDKAQSKQKQKAGMKIQAGK